MSGKPDIVNQIKKRLVHDAMGRLHHELQKIGYTNSEMVIEFERYLAKEESR